MASLDPRKNESITNQANYLMTGVTSMIIASLMSSNSTGIWSYQQYLILAALWIMVATYREIKKVVDAWTKSQSLDSSPTRTD